MIRIVTADRMKRLEQDAEQARDSAREAGGRAAELWRRHVQRVQDLTARAEHAETTASEVGDILAAAVTELAAAQEEILLKDIEIRRLRKELEDEPLEGQTLTVLLHYGEPHTIYRSRAEAHADTAAHGMPADHVWQRCSERPAAEFRWRCEAFIYDAASNGFRRAFLPSPEPVGGAA